MRRVTMTTGLHEADIRPVPLMTEFMRLSLIDSHTFFKDAECLVEVPCPGCGSEGREAAFRKNDFLYCRCSSCDSIYISPRPTRESLADYHENSSASHYRVEHFAKETSKARRQHLLSSHALWFGRIVDEKGNPEARSYADVNTQSIQIFDEIRQLGLFDTMYSLFPLRSLDEECERLGVRVARDDVAGLGGVTMLGQLENQHDPLAYLKWIRGLLAPNGVVTFTTRTVSGFDMQVLWDKTPYIFVPEHLNLLSIDGIMTLIDRAGLELVELSTPGQLDLEFVQHAAAHDPSIDLPRPVRYLLEHCGPEAHSDFQEFLQRHRLSSHVRAAAVNTGRKAT